MTAIAAAPVIDTSHVSPTRQRGTMVEHASDPFLARRAGEPGLEADVAEFAENSGSESGVGSLRRPNSPQIRLRGEAAPVAGVTLKSLFAAHRGRMALTYALFNVENLLKLAQPLVLGWAINDLLSGTYVGLLLFVAQHLLHMGISAARQMYDTRVFNDIYTGMATDLITGQRSRNEQVSRVAARSAMSRHYVEFFEQYVPMVIRSGYAVVGALLMLGWYDWTLVPLCVGLLVPAVLLNAAYGRKTLRLNRFLHDDLEKEVDIIERSDEKEVRRHFDSVGRWRVKLSDAEATNFCLMELFVLGVMAAALVQFCGNTGAEAGDIFAVFRYVIMFIMGLDSVPKLVGQFSRLHDIGGRVGGKGA